jgi:hypothetical protein
MNLIKTIHNHYKFDIYHTVKTTPRLSNDGDTVTGEWISDQYWVYVDDKKDTVHNTLKAAVNYIQKEYHEL